MKIAFASCMNIDQFDEQPIWSRVAAEQPDYLFLLGDQIYMDFFPHLGAPEYWSDTQFEQEMSTRYERQWSEPHFSQLLRQVRLRGGVHGTWDDHDFAWNNANGSVVPLSKKQIAARLFSQFVGGPAGPNGIFYATPLMAAGTQVGKAIFLDTRWNREAPGDNNNLLGEAQFAFLEAELAQELPLTIICAGTPQRVTGKGWALYRRDWEKFQRLLGQRKALFLSGDIHENAFRAPSRGTQLYEIISSGAAIKKYAVTGARHNYGVLDWSAARTQVKLVDKRGVQLYTINNHTFECQEHEPADL
jgi:alkaline phosphatase D